MRILVYGFGPYRQFRDNVTAKILRRLPRRPWLKKLVFPVKFHRGQFINAVKKTDPDIILGLGQCSSGRLLRIESRAVNRQRNHRLEKAKPIVSGGVQRLTASLELNLGRLARSSNNAGDYVCNYSMYVILDFLRSRSPAIPFGFIHIPHRYDPEKATAILAKTLGQIVPTR